THDTTDGVAGHDTDHLTSNVALTFNAKDADATRVIKVDGTAVASYDASKLADGAHSVSVTDTDVAGNTSSVSLDFTLDTSLTAPTVALVQDTTDGATGHDVDHLTSNAALAFNLQDADATRVIKVDGSTVASYDPSLLADGAHSVSVTDTDAAGNTKSASLDFTLDTTLTAPTVALVHDTSDGGAGHDADHLTSNAALSFGDKDADANRVIKVDGVAVAAYDASALADGAHNVSVTDTDAAGNTKSASLGFTLDTTLTAPTVSLVQDTSDGGAGHDADHLTSIGALAFGAKDADAARVIKVDGAQVSSYDAATLADGAHSVVVTDTDAAGNSKSATIDFTLDTTLTAPAVTLAQDTTDGGTGHASDHLTSNAALNFNAKDADANRIVKVDGNIVAAYDASALAQGAHNVAVTDTDAAGNTKSASIDFVLDSVITAPTIALAHDTTDGATGHDTDRLTSNAALVFNTKDADASRVVKVDGNTVAAYDPATLADGVHNVSVTDTDAAGNTKTTSIDFTLDTTLTAPTLALVQDTTDGIAGHNTDHLTANAALTFGAKDADAARVITVDGAVVAAYDATSLADGAHHVSVTDTDAAGNSKSASVDFTLDTSLTAPTVALAQDTTDGGAGRDSDRLTSNAALNFGAKDTDATRVIKVDGAAVASYNAAALADGAHTVSVIDTDAAGNSKTASLDFVLDTKITKPAMSLVQDTTDGAVGHDADHLTSNAALSFNGADADAARIIKVDGATVASYDASALADGAHTVEVTDTDAAGNAKSTSFNFVLDRQLTAPTLGLSEDTTDGAAGHASDGVTSKAGLIFGAKDPDAARSITVDGAAVASYDPSKLGDGAHVVVVTDTDAAGNSKSATLNFTLDTTAPATQAIALTIDSSDGSAGHASDKVSSNASLNFGSLEAGATRSFSVDNGAAAASYAAPGIDGAHNVKVTDTDIAGNSVTRSFDFTLDTKADPEGDLAVTVPDPLVSLAERSAVAYSVAGVNADANAVVTFSDGVHSVTGANGLANLSSLSDGTISVSVLATDFAGNTAQGKAASFTLDATAPVFSSAATASVTENTGANQIVYKAAATDAGTFSYSLLANNNDDAGQFSIDASGNVQLAANPDYEAKNNYHFTVVATDLAGNAAQKAVTLNVNDVNEAPTTSKIMLSTVENASILIPVIPDYATDPDANDVVTLKNVSQVTLTWAADSTASTLVNPVTKQVLNLSQVYASATISADGKSISITPSDEFDWASTGQKVNGTMSYSVVDKSGMVSTNTITLTIWGSTADKGKVLNGGNGNDNLVGTDGENVLQGANGNDTLTGGAATDALYGGNGDDKLTGGGGIDYLYGDNGNDTLDGGAARDVLFGGKGNDVLIGGTGADCFVFESSMGTDRVNDFNMAEGDKLYFVDVLSKPMTAHDFVAKYVTHVGNDLLISAPGGQVTLVGVSDTAALENAIVFTMPT
ncbi:beta strand repeat-containing protein, partial [Pseudoduganella sp. RAF19]|uniref:beta strand repeat-containing protein n=2 Tax=unclassified Pseudoduganella TaxID=2637179 RepID=UPI003F94DEF9